MSNHTARPVLLSLLILSALSACRQEDGYTTYDDCLLGEARKAQTPDAVHVVRDACRNKFPLTEEEQARKLEDEKRAIAEAAALAHAATAASGGAAQPAQPSASDPQSGETGSVYIRATPEDYVPYQPADPADVKNGKLATLIERHLDGCKRGSRPDVLALFDFRARYEFSTNGKRLAENVFNQVCGDEFKFQIIERFQNDGLVIAPSGRVENGVGTTLLCMKMYVVDNTCTRGLGISTENGELRWVYR